MIIFLARGISNKWEISGYKREDTVLYVIWYLYESKGMISKNECSL